MSDEINTLEDLQAVAGSGAATMEVDLATKEPVRDELGRSYATGKRKDAIARVWIKPGSGKVTVNGKDMNVYFARPVLQMILAQPFTVAGVEGEFDVTATVKGGGLSGQAGAVNADQVLQLVQSNLKKSESGQVVVLDGGIEQDLNVYLAKLKNPGSGWEHQFKPSAQAGMGAKPATGTAGAAGITNPWAEGSINLTRQMTLENTDPDLAAVLRREAGK